MSRSNSSLVCFAVKEEAGPFRRLIGARTGVRALVTGMGGANAERSLRAELETAPRPRCVLTCGFAGGLEPSLAAGTVVFDAADAPAFHEALSAAGARAATFHCADKVAVTAASKRELRARTAADAVEMESGVIRRVCRERGVPCATVRVISDAADEDLPLDFNALMTPTMETDFVKLACVLAKSPRKIPQLLRFQKQVSAAATALATVLVRTLDTASA